MQWNRSGRQQLQEVAGILRSIGVLHDLGGEADQDAASRSGA